MVAAGLLLTLGLTAPAGAAVAGTPAKSTPAKTSTVKAAAAAAAAPTCLSGYANSYEFYTWCKGTSPAAMRVVAQCADGDGVIGAESVDGSGNISYANCASTDSLDSTLGAGTSANWGILECSNSNGTGTFQGYIDEGPGDISGILLAWGGSGGITAGGTLMCQYSNSVPTAISLTTPPT